MSHLVMNLVSDDFSPVDLAALLRAVSQLQQPRLRILVACDSATQAGQIRRRVREKLESHDLEDRFDLDRHEGVPYFEVIFPAEDRMSAVDDELPPDSALPAQEARTSPQRTEPLDDRPVPEGRYRVKLKDVRKTEVAGRSFATILMEISDGDHRGRTIDDRVILWPSTARTQHLATALGVDADHLAEALDTSRGCEFWVRLGETVRPDGTSQLARYYFPLSGVSVPMRAVK